MDLDRIRQTKLVYDQLTPEDKAEVDANVLIVKGYLAKAFPVMPESDHAAVSWNMGETLQGLRVLPVARLSMVLEDSAAAYAAAAVDLLGWNDL